MADVVPTHRLTHEASQKMIAAGVAKANELGCKVSLAVVDQSCRLIAFLMMDGARHFSIITTQRKAITAASQRLPTGYAPEENALSMSVRMGDFTNVPGGFPIEVGGEVIGAVAAGGAKIEQDVEVAKAALAALTGRNLRAAQLIARRAHRLDDVLIAGAAAQVRGQHVGQVFVADLRVLLQHVGGEHQKARRAVAALQAVIVDEGLLQHG